MKYNNYINIKTEYTTSLKNRIRHKAKVITKTEIIKGNKITKEAL